MHDKIVINLWQSSKCNLHCGESTFPNSFGTLGCVMAAYLCETCHYLCKYFPQNISYLESGGFHDLTCDLCTWKVTHFRSIVQLNHSVQRRVPDRIETGKSLFFNPDLNLLLQKEANDEGTSLLLSRGKSPDRSFYQSLFLASHRNASQRQSAQGKASPMPKVWRRES